MRRQSSKLRLEAAPWYKLRSKPGKKEKERGEIEVDIQFMRSNMTASMFDLSMKDKPRSTFGKLKDKLKGKRSSGLSDTASAIVPGTSHSPADSEDESVEKEKKKLKFKTLFSKPGLQKTSLSQSMSVLPTVPPAKEKVRLRPSDFQSRWDDEESEMSPTSDKTFRNTLEEKSSPVSKFHKITTLDSRHLNQITTGNTKKEGLSLFGGLKSKSDPVSKSSLCINGSHVYMEENTPKDNTPASSPSPLNFRRKQHFASEENLASKFTKGPEETGRTSPSGVLSGSASLETFKSMTLPSYKLLSSEDYTETHVPLTVDVKESKKTDNKKSALLSLVTGKKEMVKNSDVESVPDRTLKEEENKDSEGKSEKETKHLEIPTDLSKGNPFDNSNEEEIFKNKQPLNPFEEDQKSEKAAVSAKTAQTKAVKPRLGVTSEEEPKATLSIFAPDSLSAFLSARQIKGGSDEELLEDSQEDQNDDAGLLEAGKHSSQSYSSSPSFPSHTQSDRAESPTKPTAEGSAGKAENSGKRKLLRAWVSPSETYPSQTQQGGEPLSPKHRLQPVKPMNAITSKSQAKNTNVISAMNDKLLEMSTKKYSPSDPGYAYAQLTHDELIQLVLKQKDTINKKELQVRELEDYIDNLLVRVMEETPNILRVPTSGNKKAGKI
ncbi:PREDICTED: rab11 family-interacting protein 1 [Tinamus guttatus]|uniref:rab11 family-interacting protein 1 n=1 Tax=Tinamus guttatus TaxID=94827 RepID=UPI00052F0FD4|nr:PREDICTED: rab11 family-interacting protein 1 [Tinamus guttatus]